MDDRHDDLEAGQTAISFPLFSANPAIAIDHHPLRVHPDTPASTAVNWMCQGQLEARAIASQPASEPRQPANYALVMEGEQLCGIVTERDVVKWVSEGIDLSTTPVSAVMTTPLITFAATDLNNPFAALETFRRHRIRHLPIVDAQNRIVGVIMPEHLRQALQAAHLLRLRRIAEVMTTQVVTATADLPAIALAALMAQHQVSCVVIVEPLPSGAEGDRPIGIVTERDIVQFHNLQLDLPTLTAAAVMSAPLVCMQPEDSLWEAHLQMQRMRVRRMVLSDQGRLAGIITQTSILSVLDPNEMSRTIAILQAEVQQLHDQRLALLQQQTEQLSHQLLSTEQRFQAIFNNTFQFTGLLTPDGTLIEANQAALSFSGLSREQVVNRPFWQVDWWAISPQTQAQLQEAIAQAAQGEFVRYEVEVWGVNQQAIWLDFSIRPIQDPDGQVILLIPEGRDITALKQAQRNLEFQAACNHLIANISSRFIQLSTQEISAGIQHALQEIGQLTQVDVCYIFRFADAEGTFQVTHEWLAAGIEPNRNRDQPLAQTEFPWSMQRLHQGETVYVPSVYRLPPEAAPDQQGWQSFGLQSVLTIPLNDHGQITGAVGFASFRQERQWSDDNIRILQVFADILTHATQRQQVELALQQSEQRYASLAEAAPVGIFRSDAEGGCIYTNDRYQQITGLAAHRALGMGWANALHPADRDRIVGLWQHAVANGQPFQQEYRFQWSDGQKVWVFGQAVPEHDAHGQVTSYIGTITDITERKQAEQRLQSSEDRLKEAQHIAQLGSWELDLQSNTLLWSDEIYRIFEIDPQQFEGTYEAFLEAIHPDDRAMVNQAYTDSLTHRTPYQIVHRLLLPDGRIKYVQEQCQTFYNDQGQAIRSMGTIQDITELKATQDSLRISEERLRLALRAANQGLYDLNLQTGEAIVSTEYATMLGYDPDTFQESNARWIERLHPDDRATVAETYRAYVQGEIPDYAVEFRQRTKTGEWKWILSLGSILAWDEAGKPLRMLGTHTDISDRKQAEAERLRAEKMRLEMGLLEGILDVVLAGYWDWDLLSNQEYLSPGFKRMFGYADDELSNTPESWQRLIFAEDLPGVIACLERHLASHGESPFYNEVRYHHKDGSTIWVICSGQVIEWDAAGRGLRMIGCHINITPHKQAEALLLKSDAHLKTAQRISQLGSWEFDLRTEQIHWSDEVYRIFGRDLAVGPPDFETLQQYVHPDDRTPHQQAVQTTISTGQTYEIEFRIYRSDQALRYLQARGELITDAHGNTVQLVGTVLDISDRKQAEEQLRNLSDRLSLAIQSGAIGTWDWDIIHEATWDQRMYEIYGLQDLGRPATYQDWLDCLHVDDRDTAEAALHSALQGNQDFDIEFRIWRHSDGQLRWVKATAMVQRDPEGRPLRMTGINYDITERKQAETQLMQTAAQLQASNQELEAFAYSVSHDLRSPLRAIDGFSRALLEDYGHQFD
ncbi:MAG TPA: PAS domain-containing protein, partial [Chroococcidiopsis sp.]